MIDKTGATEGPAPVEPYLWGGQIVVKEVPLIVTVEVISNEED
jgi:hypothetical protein